MASAVRISSRWGNGRVGELLGLGGIIGRHREPCRKDSPLKDGEISSSTRPLDMLTIVDGSYVSDGCAPLEFDVSDWEKTVTLRSFNSRK